MATEMNRGLEWRIMGLTLKNDSDSQVAKMLGRQGNSVVVAEVQHGSPADWEDIRPGDLIQEVGRFKPTTSNNWKPW